jgi:hypothetical protein
MKEQRSKFNLKFLPEDFQEHILNIKKKEGFSLTLSNPRKSKLGDYRYNYRTKSHQITINIDLEAIYFLITYLHEVAHKMCWDQYKRKAQPHGKEWKSLFVSLLWSAKYQIKLSDSDNEIVLGFINNPQARFQKFNSCDDYYLKVSDLQPNSIFELQDGKIFQLISKRRTRFLCLNTVNKKEYTVLGTTPVNKIHSGGAFIPQ